MKNTTTKIIDIDYHRNGVRGNGFHVVLFDWKEESSPKRRMIATIFADSGNCAVYEVAQLNKGNIKFGSNSWCGDEFEKDMRKAIELYEKTS